MDSVDGIFKEREVPKYDARKVEFVVHYILEHENFPTFAYGEMSPFDVVSYLMATMYQADRLHIERYGRSVQDEPYFKNIENVFTGMINPKDQEGFRLPYASEYAHVVLKHYWCQADDDRGYYLSVSDIQCLDEALDHIDGMGLREFWENDDLYQKASASRGGGWITAMDIAEDIGDEDLLEYMKG